MYIVNRENCLVLTFIGSKYTAAVLQNLFWNPKLKNINVTGLVWYSLKGSTAFASFGLRKSML